MRTVGIDVASKDAKTATCWIDWEGGQATVAASDVTAVTDAEIRRCCKEADRVGIDVPLGWPGGFVAAIGRHHGHEPWQDIDMETLRLRATDRWLTQTARRPR